MKKVLFIIFLGCFILSVSAVYHKLGSYATPGYARSVMLENDTAFVADEETGHQSIANSSKQILLGSYDTPGYANSITVVNNTAYVADEDGGLQIIDVTNSQNPVLLGSYSAWSFFYSVTVVNNTAYVVDDWAGLAIIDVTNPQNPVLLGVSSSQGHAGSVTVVNNTAYVANGDVGLAIIDITNSQDPILCATYQTPFFARSVTVVNNKAYVADEYSGMQIIDVTNSLYPALLGSYDTPGYAWSVTVVNNTAYVADYLAGLQIIDVTSSQNPILISTILPHADSCIQTCYVNENKLYISDVNWNEISIYDISAPQSPTFLATYAWNQSTYDMCMSGNIFYTANGVNGLNIHDLTEVSNEDVAMETVSLPMLEIFPNPFNPETTIEYTLPINGHTTLCIYNCRGQLVKQLYDSHQTSGTHSIKWDGKNDSNHSVASGIYFCKISSQGKTAVRKIMMIK